MGPPSLWHHTRQILGRALRESGQALERLGVKTVAVTITPHDFYDDPVLYEDYFSRHRHQQPLLSAGRPVVHREIAFCAPCSTLVGSVYVGADSSVWYGAVLRGDDCENVQAHSETYVHEGGTVVPKPWEVDRVALRQAQDDHQGGAIFVGERTNLQDGVVVTARQQHCTIGNGVTVGHMAQIHSATVGNACMIGMGSLVSEGAVVEDEAFIAAGAVIPPNTTVRSGELWVGNPARKIRDLSKEERERLHYQSDEYVKVASTHKRVEELGGNYNDDGINVHYIQHPETDNFPLYNFSATELDDGRQPNLLLHPPERRGEIQPASENAQIEESTKAANTR